MISGANIGMFVLDSMVDDIENMDSIMHDLTLWRFSWPHDFTEEEVITAIKHLIAKDYVKVFEEQQVYLTPVDGPCMDDMHIKQYWYEPTEKGRKIWKQWKPPPVES